MCFEWISGQPPTASTGWSL